MYPILSYQSVTQPHASTSTFQGDASHPQYQNCSSPSRAHEKLISTSTFVLYLAQAFLRNPAMTTTPEPANEGIYIPTELLWMILSHVQELPNPQETLASCSLVCRQWCSAATFLLYQKPKILPKNFHAFAEAITSPNLPRARKGDLGQYVRRLDLSDLVHHSTKSLTARLLRDVREGLEVFIAPVHTVS